MALSLTPRPSASSTAVSGADYAAAVHCPLFLVIFLHLPGCTGTSGKINVFGGRQRGPFPLLCYRKRLRKKCSFQMRPIPNPGSCSIPATGTLSSYLGAPEQPKAAIVYAPGAGEKLAGHEERMVRFASAGYAFLFVDTRGNGGETAGIPFSQQTDPAGLCPVREGGDAPVLSESV